MRTHVAAGLGWPGHVETPDSVLRDRPTAGLGWPEPTRATAAAAGWTETLLPATATTRPQAAAASRDTPTEDARVETMSGTAIDGTQDLGGVATTDLTVTSGGPSPEDARAVSRGAAGPDLSLSAEDRAALAAPVSRETEGPDVSERSQDTAAPAPSVSRETDDESAPLADALGQPHDTPIAQAAATAVRVLGGRYGSPMPRPARTRVMTVANQKGGVGKTTSTVNIAAALALHGAEVLVVDLDPQGNASTALGVDHHSDVPSVYDILIEGRPVDEVVTEVEGLKGLSCVPATIDLAGAEIELVSVVARESRLKKALDAYAAYRAEHGQARLDYVLVDCPPSLGLLTVNALVAAEEVLIPIQCEYYALEGLGQLIRNVDLVKAHLNPQLHVSTILLTMYDARTRLAAQVADEVRAHFTETVLRTTIPRSVRISEAPSYGQTVLTYDPASTGALSYLEAAREMAVRGARPDEKETTS